MTGELTENPNQPWSPTNPFGYTGDAPPPAPAAPGAPPVIRVDAPAATQTYTAGQSGLQEHRNAIPDHDATGLDDPLIADALNSHNKTSKDRFDAADADLAGGKTAAGGFDDADQRGKRKADAAADPGALSALRNALSQPAAAASPFAAAPMPAMPMPAPAAMPAPMPMPAVAPGMVNMDPNALAKLISNANVSGVPTAKTALSGATGRAPGKDELSLDEVAIQPTGIGTLTRSQLHAVIDKALDNNGVTKDPTIRGIWHDLCYQQYTKESSGVVDAVNRDDTNARGAMVPTDQAPAGSSRGLGQCIPETFAKFHVAGTSNNIYDPEANLSASVGYMMHTYKVSADGTGLAEFYAARRASGFGGY
ncbi:transglycosylase SLT domain-containing protein [Mycobacterium intracellulare]|uniref:transglycosylase SLT domain-containing protein n=1 Tax=Mycobacterium intracellulare TaxID=1767 RepID=UPI00111C22A8|nr:transglycosylase SLT domain-containing protein [Mycobacterium intracellulare]UCN12882.1 transglycosylase SLT domain-containing protein [Mycobacterium intracellulare subsp. chimaera]